MKLSTGRKVELKQPTIEDRIKCNDAKTIGYNKDTGEITFSQSFKALALWACAGLGCEIKDLNEYSDVEIAEIGKEAEAMSSLNPSKPQS